MRFVRVVLFAFCLLALVQSTHAADWFVATSGSDAAAGTSWATAKQTIQAAVTAAAAHDTVWVSNGVYSTGGITNYPSGARLTNRVAIHKPITVRSLNGPDVTRIQGARDQLTAWSYASVRCVYMTNGATLAGFTLNGGTRNYLEDYDGCGAGVWCEGAGAVISNCVFVTNVAGWYGGGAYGGTLYDCALAGNTATNGGGAYGSTLYNCTLTSNTAGGLTIFGGGGAYGCTLHNCTLTGNSTMDGGGGGANDCTLNNCLLTGNMAMQGGGACNSTLNNCLLRGNAAFDEGGGGADSTFNNCTVFGNSSANTGGGIAGSEANNCIIYSNSAFSSLNYNYSTIRFSCTAPDPGDPGNITNDPQFVSMPARNYRLRETSPCIGKGSNGYVQGTTDLDSRPRIAGDRVDMGAYEFQSLTWYTATNGNDGAAGTNWATAKATIQAAADRALPGETVLVSNGVYGTGGRPYSGFPTNRLVVSNAVTIQSVSGPAATFIVGAADPAKSDGCGTAAVRCVYLNNGARLIGFTVTNGHTLDLLAGGSGGGISCFSTNAVVSNCVLTGNTASWHGGGVSDGTLDDCQVIGNEARNGGGGMETVFNRCLLSANTVESDGGGAYGGSLSGCTVVGNTADDGGGAAWGSMDNCAVYGNWASGRGGGAYAQDVANCVLSNNFAYRGGGTFSGTILNSLLVSNSAFFGGGSCSGTLYHCTLTGNTATNQGGGMLGSRMFNSIVYFNLAPTGYNWFVNISVTNINYCCTRPTVTTDPGRTTNDPLFVSAAARNYRLMSNSPCVDKGTNLFAAGSMDLDGNPRTVNGRADMGAYEFQYNGGYWAWARRITNGLTNFSQCATGDGYPNLLKYATGSNPTNSDGAAHLDGEVTDGQLSLGFNRNTNAVDVTLIVETSHAVTNGAPWNGIATNIGGSWGGAINVTENGASSPTAVTVTDSAVATNRFLRLRVTRP